jgi:RNA polymerase sigma-70 factor (ECF subfamily)
MRWLLSDYRRLEKRIKRLLGGRQRTREDAEDLIQEALLRLHEYYQSADVRNQDAFLIRTIRNLSIDRHRRDRRHLYASETLEELEANVPLLDSAPTAEDVCAAQQRLDQIWATLNAASPRTREIYFAHRAGFSYAEIGAHLGITKSTIEKHVARAILVLMDEKDIE